MHQAMDKTARRLQHRGLGGYSQQRRTHLPSVKPITSHRSCVCQAADKSKDNSPADEPAAARNRLEATIKRKSQQVESQLKELGLEALEERLQSAVKVPATPAYRLATMVADAATRGNVVLVFEISRPSPSATNAELIALAKQYVSLGADALAVNVDSEYSPNGMLDLFTVCQAVKVPVLAIDWIIHPLQVVEAKQAGAAGIIGVIGQVNGRGTAVMSSFAAAVGLDAPVEVVNALEVEGLAKAGVVFYGINLQVGLSLPIPGFSSDIAHGILGKLPFGAVSLVGVRSMEEARKARQSGADCLLIKQDLIKAYTPDEKAKEEAKKNPFAMTGLRRLVEELRYLTSGDD